MPKHQVQDFGDTFQVQLLATVVAEGTHSVAAMSRLTESLLDYHLIPCWTVDRD